MGTHVIIIYSKAIAISYMYVNVQIHMYQCIIPGNWKTIDDAHVYDCIFKHTRAECKHIRYMYLTCQDIKPYPLLLASRVKASMHLRLEYTIIQIPAFTWGAIKRGYGYYRTYYRKRQSSHKGSQKDGFSYLAVDDVYNGVVEPLLVGDEPVCGHCATCIRNLVCVTPKRVVY